MIRKAFAFIKRDFLIASTYKLSFSLSWGRALAALFPFYFIAKLFLSEKAPSLANYGGVYFPFVLVGITFRRFLEVALSGFKQVLLQEHAEGSLEVLFLSPTPIVPLFILLSIGRLLFSLLELFLYFLLGATLFGVPLGQANFPAAFLILLLTTVAFYGVGTLSCAFFIVFKQTSPLDLLFGGLSSFLGGVYFPMELLPPWLQWGSRFFPLTYVLRAMRQALFTGASLELLQKDLFVLGGLAVTLFPFSLWVFGKAMQKARRDGTLDHF